MPVKSVLLMHSKKKHQRGDGNIKEDGCSSEAAFLLLALKSCHINIFIEQAKTFTDYYLFIFCFPAFCFSFGPQFTAFPLR